MRGKNKFILVALLSFLITTTGCGLGAATSELDDVTFGTFKEFNYAIQGNLHYNHYFVINRTNGVHVKDVAIPDGSVTNIWRWNVFGNGRHDCGEATYNGIDFGDHGQRGRPGGPIFGAGSCTDNNMMVTSLSGVFEVLSYDEIVALQQVIGADGKIKIEVVLEYSASGTRAERILHDGGLRPYAGKRINRSELTAGVKDRYSVGPTTRTNISVRNDLNWHGETHAVTFELGSISGIRYDNPNSPLTIRFNVSGAAVQFNQLKIKVLRPY